MTFEAACKYMELGFKVFPVHAYYDNRACKWVKMPATMNGFKDAISDPSLAGPKFHTSSWWGMVHNHMTVVDADGEQGVDTLNRALPLLPEASVVVRTISGGIHYYLAGTVPFESRKVRLLPGLDLLTGNDKGFVVIPPSPGYKTITGSFEDLAEDIQDELARKASDSPGTGQESDCSGELPGSPEPPF